MPQIWRTLCSVWRFSCWNPLNMFSQHGQCPHNPTGIGFGYRCILIPSKMELLFLFHGLPIVLGGNFKREGGDSLHPSLSSSLTFSKKSIENFNASWNIFTILKKKIYRKYRKRQPYAELAHPACKLDRKNIFIFPYMLCECQTQREKQCKDFHQESRQMAPISPRFDSFFDGVLYYS